MHARTRRPHDTAAWAVVATLALGLAACEDDRQALAELDAPETADVHVEPDTVRDTERVADTADAPGPSDTAPAQDTAAPADTAPDEIADRDSAQAPFCPRTWALCDGACIDTMSDAAHCGDCARACDMDSQCVSGLCVAPPPCPAGRIECDGACVDVLEDAQHCGACGQACRSDQVCTDGACQCPPGHAPCRGTCVDVLGDARHCGACGAHCAANEVCVDGACECAPGQTRCGAECVYLASNANHCGACFAACAAGVACFLDLFVLSPVSSDCGYGAPCPAGALLCDGICVDPQRNDAHCGACDVACAAGEMCEGGTCVPTCPIEHALCDGVCVDLLSDPLDCGACGDVCPAGEACVAGSCATSICPLGTELCDSECVAPGTCTCPGGTCTAGCPPGQTDCGGICADLAVDEAHCGACGVTCDPDQACDAGTCVLPPAYLHVMDLRVGARTLYVAPDGTWFGMRELQAPGAPCTEHADCPGGRCTGYFAEAQQCEYPQEVLRGHAGRTVSLGVSYANQAVGNSSSNVFFFDVLEDAIASNFFYLYHYDGSGLTPWGTEWSEFARIEVLGRGHLLLMNSEGAIECTAPHTFQRTAWITAVIAQTSDGGSIWYLDPAQMWLVRERGAYHLAPAP